MIPVHANGAPRRPFRLAATGGLDPMHAVLALGRNARRVVGVALVAALLIHGTAAARAAVIPVELMLWSQAIGRAVHQRIMETYEVDLLKAEPPPPPPPAEPPPPQEEPKEAPPVVVRETKPNEAPSPAPAAAKASAVLTQAPDPNEPVDLTNSFVTGTADSYAGGVTQTTGTSNTAVYGARNTAPGGAPGGTGKTPGPAGNGPDRSRAASLAGSKDWKCDFPPEADVDQIDQAFVVVQVATRADGSPDRVTILSDPGHGFGRAARVCAMRERYDPALDREGNAVAGSTKSIRIRFER
jgi:protein TonB